MAKNLSKPRKLGPKKRKLNNNSANERSSTEESIGLISSSAGSQDTICDGGGLEATN